MFRCRTRRHLRRERNQRRAARAAAVGVTPRFATSSARRAVSLSGPRLGCLRPLTKTVGVRLTCRALTSSTSWACSPCISGRLDRAQGRRRRVQALQRVACSCDRSFFGSDQAITIDLATVTRSILLSMCLRSGPGDGEPRAQAAEVVRQTAAGGCLPSLDASGQSQRVLGVKALRRTACGRSGLRSRLSA